MCLALDFPSRQRLELLFDSAVEAYMLLIPIIRHINASHIRIIHIAVIPKA